MRAPPYKQMAQTNSESAQYVPILISICTRTLARIDWHYARKKQGLSCTNKLRSMSIVENQFNCKLYQLWNYQVMSRAKNIWINWTWPKGGGHTGFQTYNFATIAALIWILKSNIHWCNNERFQCIWILWSHYLINICNSSSTCWSRQRLSLWELPS